jgi:hypothetical protein
MYEEESGAESENARRTRPLGVRYAHPSLPPTETRKTRLEASAGALVVLFCRGGLL